MLSLRQVGQETVALLAAGHGAAASIFAAWSRGGTGGWTLSSLLSTGGATLLSASSGPGGTVMIDLGGRRAEIAAPGRAWQRLPRLPPGTVILAAGPASRTADAFAVRRATLTIWRASPASQGWTKTQTISVPIQYGSSG